MVGVRRARAVAGALILSCFAPVAALAQTTGLEDMVGAQGGQAEGELQRRGYVNVGGAQGNDRAYAYWWNEDRQQCVTITTIDGRYNAIQPTVAPDCRRSTGRSNPHEGERSARGYPPSSGYAPPPADLPPQQYRDSGRAGMDAPSVDGRNVELGLVCFGDGSKDGLATGSTWSWNDRSNRYEYDRYTTTRTEQFDASLMVQTWNGGGRIRLPKSLIPPLHSGGQDGWWDLYDVSVGPDEIRATYRLNGMNKPRVTIDRRSGRIDVQGYASYGFRGSCDTVDHRPRRF